jgi:hypothetical protein
MRLAGRIHEDSTRRLNVVEVFGDVEPLARCSLSPP